MNFNTYIKSAKQLHNTFITNDCHVKRDVYLALCEMFGILPREGVSEKNRGFLECVCVNNAVGVRVYFANKPELTSKELHLADLVDLHDSYVMTSDFGTAKQFGDLVGDAISGAEFLKFNVVRCIDSNVLEFYHVSESNIAGIVQNKTELTSDLINAMYAEKVKLKSLNDDYAAERKPVSLTDFLKRTDPVKNEEKAMQSNQAQVKVKSEFVLIEDSIFDLRPYFEAGELFYRKDGTGRWCAIQNENQLMEKLLSEPIYRRIEKPVDWREEIEAYLESACEDENENSNFNGMIVSSDDWAYTYYPTNEQFLEMCRVALRATGELK